MKKINLTIVFGGVSPEHEISLKSCASVYRGLAKEKYNITLIGITKSGVWYYLPSCSADDIERGEWEKNEKLLCSFSSNRACPGIILKDSGELLPIDVVFPVMHGENAEDGRFQGMCELAGVPCVGPKSTSSAVCMDKALTKLVVEKTGIRQADWILVTKKSYNDATILEIENKFSYPVFVKPTATGSSVGASKAENHAELQKALSDALVYGGRALVEEFIPAREIETAVLGNDELTVSVCGEVLSETEVYSYESKYNSTVSKTVIPADLSEETSEKIRGYAKKVYEALDCRGLSRVDFFINKKTGEIVFNEINTIPGFTNISMYAKLLGACGIEFSELLDRIISYAMEE